MLTGGHAESLYDSLIALCRSTLSKMVLILQDASLDERFYIAHLIEAQYLHSLYMLL